MGQLLSPLWGLIQSPYGGCKCRSIGHCPQRQGRGQELQATALTGEACCLNE